MSAPALPGRRPARVRFDCLVPWLLGGGLTLSTLFAVLRPLRTPANWMYFEQDDFFYYLKVAQQLASGHGSTFNGLVPTNGYHPLWMLMLAALLRAGAGPNGVFHFVAASIVVSTLCCFALSTAVLRNAGLRAVTASAFSVFVAVYCMRLFSEGMEVTLAVPLVFATLFAVQSTSWWARPGTRALWPGLALGLLASATILARLDTAIYVALLALGVALQRELRCRVSPWFACGITAGLLPVAAYFSLNRALFGVWIPVSGMAKQMKLHPGFSSRIWKSFLELTPTQWLSILTILAAIIALPRLWHRLRPGDRAPALAALLFPPVYFVALSWLSDWRLWGWYYYSLRPALCFAFVVLFAAQPVKRLFAGRLAIGTLVLLSFARLWHLKWDEQNPAIVQAARELAAFATIHPGVYAMGDRSGAVGYLLPAPMVQAEGLMMDRRYLTFVRQQVPLREALAHYGVRYYVGTTSTPYTGCFHAVEPWQAGANAPHMQADLCTPPVAHWTHDGVQTMVFDLAKETSR